MITQKYLDELTYEMITSAIEENKGIIINFNCSNIFKEGQKTIVNDYFKKLSLE
jgi:hypothetical protein